ASFTTPAGESASGDNWQLSGTTIGGWTPGSAPTSPTTNGDSTTAYWVVAGTGLNQTFSVKVGGFPTSSMVTFNIAGPTGTGITVSPGTWPASSTSLNLGSSDQALCIRFDAEAAPPTG